MKTVFRRWRWVWAGLLLFSLLAIAQVYTWTDEQGRKHFGDEVTTPGNQRETPVNIPPPNVAEPFKPDTPPAAPSAPDAPAEVAAPVPAALTDPMAGTPKRPGVAAEQEACKAQNEAYEASKACFAECSTLNKPGSGRNNAQCGHCTPMTKPRC